MLTVLQGFCSSADLLGLNSNWSLHEPGHGPGPKPTGTDAQNSWHLFPWAFLGIHYIWVLQSIILPLLLSFLGLNSYWCLQGPPQLWFNLPYMFFGSRPAPSLSSLILAQGLPNYGLIHPTFVWVPGQFLFQLSSLGLFLITVEFTRAVFITVEFTRAVSNYGWLYQGSCYYSWVHQGCF